MEEVQLIAKLKELKSISPRKEWVLLTKAQLFKAEVFPQEKAIFTSLWSNIVNVVSRKQVVYSLAALAVVIAGTYGIMKFPLPFAMDAAKSSTASLAIETNLKNNVQTFITKSQNLSDASRNKSGVLVALKEVKEAAKSVTETIKKDPQLASKVALEINNNKTYLDVAGGNTSNEVSGMYEAVVVPLIKDLVARTLNSDQAKELKRIKDDLAANGDYAVALRDILIGFGTNK